MRKRLAVLASSRASNCQPRPDEDRWGSDGISRSVGAATRSAERYRQGKSTLTGFFVLTIHVLRGLGHRGDRGVQIDPMPAGDFIAGDRISGPCFDRAECASLDARN